MYKTLALIGALMLCAVTPAASESAAEFFYKDKHYWSKGQRAPEVVTYSALSSYSAVARDTAVTHVPAQRQAVADRVAHHAAARLGSQWVPTALKLAKIESGFNCRATGPRTRHGNAKGVLQVMPGSARALGYDHRRLHECDYGIAAGIAHMESCIRAGVRTHAEMAKCHVAGTHGWKTRLNRSAERYKARYVRMAMR